MLRRRREQDLLRREPRQGRLDQASAPSFCVHTCRVRVLKGKAPSSGPSRRRTEDGRRKKDGGTNTFLLLRVRETDVTLVLGRDVLSLLCAYAFVWI